MIAILAIKLNKLSLSFTLVVSFLEKNTIYNIQKIIIATKNFNKNTDIVICILSFLFIIAL